MKKILFVCHGNICRSTMAESVMTHLVNERNLADKYYINSAATSTEEIGSEVHFGTKNVLKRHGIVSIPHRAVQLKKSDYDNYDLIIGMDNANIRNILKIVGGDDKNKVHMMLEYTNEHREVADPWYTGDFDKTFEDVLKGCKGLLEKLEEVNQY